MHLVKYDDFKTCLFLPYIFNSHLLQIEHHIKKYKVTLVSENQYDV